MHNAKKYYLGPGVAPQTPIYLFPKGQQRFIWIPRMGVFELHSAKNKVLVLRWRPKHPYIFSL